MTVENMLKKEGVHYSAVRLGEVDLEEELNSAQQKQIEDQLKQVGFELIVGRARDGGAPQQRHRAGGQQAAERGRHEDVDLRREGVVRIHPGRAPRSDVRSGPCRRAVDGPPLLPRPAKRPRVD